MTTNSILTTIAPVRLEVRYCIDWEQDDWNDHKSLIIDQEIDNRIREFFVGLGFTEADAGTGFGWRDLGFERNTEATP